MLLLLMRWECADGDDEFDGGDADSVLFVVLVPHAHKPGAVAREESLRARSAGSQGEARAEGCSARGKLRALLPKAAPLRYWGVAGSLLGAVVRLVLRVRSGGCFA